MSYFIKANLLFRRFAFHKISAGLHAHETIFTEKLKSELNANANATKIVSYFSHFVNGKLPSETIQQNLEDFADLLVKKIDFYHDQDIVKIIQKCSLVNPTDFQTNSVNLLYQLSQRIRNFKRPYPSLNFYYDLSKLTSILSQKDLEYESIFKRFLMNFNFNTPEVGKLIRVLVILFSLTSKNKEFECILPNGRSIFEHTEKIFNNIIDTKNVDMRTIFIILKFFIRIDRFSEDFLQKLEGIVFKNLSLLTSDILIDLPYCYSYRILHNSKYIVETVYKALYEEILQRFDTLTDREISDFVHRYWKFSQIFGLYCDERLSAKLYEIIENPSKYTKVSKDQLYLFSNILTYLDYSRSITPAILDKIYDQLDEFYHDLSSSMIMTVSIYLSRHVHPLRTFWKKFNNDIPKLLEMPNIKLGMFYPIQLNLRLRNPEVYEVVRENISKKEEEMANLWLKARTDDVSGSKPSHLHKNFMQELENSHIEYVYEYYDDYYIDIALPKYKIGFEILGPGHYLFPSGLLNGRTISRQLNLEKKGWTIHIVPYYLTRNEAPNFIKRYLASAIPLDS